MTAIDDYNSDFTSVSDDILFDEDRGYAPGSGGGGGGVFWGLKRPSTTKVYFMTPGPWTKASDHGWWSWREVFAEAGLVGVGELPFGMKAFPVRDQVTYTDEEGNTRRRDILPTEEGYDHLLSLVVPFQGRFSKKPERPVKDQVGVAVVEVAAGGELYPKVLTMSANRYRKVSEVLKGYRAMNPGFSLVGFPWMLSLTGDTSANEVISLIPLPDEPAIDLPEPIDIPEQLRLIKQRVLEVVQSHTGVDTSGYVAAEQAPPPATVAPQVPETVPSAPEPAPAPVDKAALYATMTDTRLKTLLTKKGVSVAPKTGRDELIRLALANQV